MIVCGNNDDYRLGGSLNNRTSKPENIMPFCQSSLEVSSLLSFSTYHHSVWITKNGEAFAVGSNEDGIISSTMPKINFGKDTKINLKYKNGKPCNFISAVNGNHYTLYLVSGETSNDTPQLILAYSDENTIFLNIGKRSPVSLFGGNKISAAIDTEGSVIIITRSVFKSPASELEALKLPDNEKAVKAACCDQSVIVLSESGNVFECSFKAKKKSFVKVSELQKTKINDISGTFEHFLAITNDNRVFGRGRNGFCRLGFPESIENVNEFEVIESLSKYNVVEAMAGYFDSMFITAEGQILGCGWNPFGELMLKRKKSNVYPPEETSITSGGTFCISAIHASVAFVDVKPPPNTPNRKIAKFSASKTPRNDSEKVIKASTDEISKLRKSLELKDKEINSLKEENSSLKEENSSLKKESSSLKKKLEASQKHINEIEAENKKLKIKLKEKEKEEEKKVTNGSKKGSSLDILDIDTLDKMKKIKSLGRGATSEVFEVTRETRFALKVYYPEIICDENDDEEEEEKIIVNANSMRKFLLEYESINQLDHANIVKAFGISFGDAKHPPAILLEYCASNLKEKIKELTNSERICAIVDISSAMKTVHSVGIIHRDLKLENILLDENNKIKVSDFGLCTLMTVDNESKSRTQMTGTLKYMAPELLQERSDYNEKVDIYSFGVVVYLILTKGEFPKIGFADVIAGKKADIPSTISEFSKSLINKCWSYKASDRPSFAEICDILKGNESKLI